MKSKRLWAGILASLAILAVGALMWRPVIGMTGLPSFIPHQQTTAPSVPHAAIVDQVSLTHPNQEFIDLATAMLEAAGYQVDVYSGDEITVGFYEDLATHGYQMIVFRTHSSDIDATGEIGLFTSEVYAEDRWALEQLRGRLAYGDTIPDESGTNYFAVVPAFIREEMQGTFDDTLLIIGGCESLATPHLARAFVEKGASAVIGWNDTVDLTHNDRAILRLLLALLGENGSVEQAVRRTMLELGPDPIYGSRLVYMESDKSTSLR